MILCLLLGTDSHIIVASDSCLTLVKDGKTVEQAVIGPVQYLVLEVGEARWLEG